VRNESGVFSAPLDLVGLVVTRGDTTWVTVVAAAYDLDIIGVLALSVLVVVRMRGAVALRGIAWRLQSEATGEEDI
jgi:hypothetical protein